MENQDDVSVASAESRCYDPVDLDDEILQLLKDDTSAEFPVDSIWVNDNELDPLSIDWVRDGHAISENASLQMIDINSGNNRFDPEGVSERDQRSRIRNAKAFYRAVAANRSIRYLSIEGNLTDGLDMEDTIAILASFLQNNSNLRSFVVGHFTLSLRTAQLLASALSKCNTRLNTFGLVRCGGITGKTLSLILEAMRTRPNIESLLLCENDISDDVAAVLGDGLRTTSGLKHLSLAGHSEMRMIDSISTAGVESISNGLRGSSLERLNFRHNHIGPQGGLVLAEAISNSAVKKLDLREAVSPHYAEFGLSREGWSLFFESLENCELCDLRLGYNILADEDVVTLVSSINTMRSLSHLDLADLKELTALGWCTLFKHLKRNNSIRTFNMPNHSLRSHFATRSDEEDLVCAALADALCDRTSIESVLKSNHTLEKVEDLTLFGSVLFHNDVSEVSLECKSLLMMNEGTNKADVAKQKIIQYYFLGGNKNELGDMPLGLIPRVLEGIGKERLQSIYELVGALPSLLHYTREVTSGKRKRV